MDINQKFCIQVGERLCSRLENFITREWHHAFLTLTKENTTFQRSDVLQEIHINPNDMGYLEPVFYHGVGPRKFTKTTYFPILSGDESAVLPVWNHIGRYAESLSETAIQFGPDSRYNPTSINCRTAVREILKIGGLTLYDEFTLSAAGMRAPAFALGQKYQHLPPIDAHRIA